MRSTAFAATSRLLLPLLALIGPAICFASDSSTATSAATSATRLATESISVSDDVYHCRYPQLYADRTISCDPTTYRWNVEDLDPASPPQDICGPADALTFTDEQISTLPDSLEPCFLWWKMHGDGIGDGRNVASTSYHSDAVTADRALSASSAGDIEDSLTERTREFTPFTLIMQFSDQKVGADGEAINAGLVLDRTELFDVTYQHIVETLKAKIYHFTGSGADQGDGDGDGDGEVTIQVKTGSSSKPSVEDVELVLASTHLSINPLPTLYEAVSGITIFVAAQVVITREELDSTMKEAFHGDALELYMLRLKLSKDEGLQRIASVEWRAGTGKDVAPPSQQGGNGNSGGENGGRGGTPGDGSKSSSDDGVLGDVTWSSTSILAIVGSVGMVIGAICITCIWLICSLRKIGPNSRRRGRANQAANKSRSLARSYGNDNEHGDGRGSGNGATDILKSRGSDSMSSNKTPKRATRGGDGSNHSNGTIASANNRRWGRKKRTAAEDIDRHPNGFDGLTYLNADGVRGSANPHSPGYEGEEFVDSDDMDSHSITSASLYSYGRAGGGGVTTISSMVLEDDTSLSLAPSLLHSINAHEGKTTQPKRLNAYHYGDDVEMDAYADGDDDDDDNNNDAGTDMNDDTNIGIGIGASYSRESRTIDMNGRSGHDSHDDLKSSSDESTPKISPVWSIMSQLQTHFGRDDDSDESDAQDMSADLETGDGSTGNTDGPHSRNRHEAAGRLGVNTAPNHQHGQRRRNRQSQQQQQQQQRYAHPPSASSSVTTPSMTYFNGHDERVVRNDAADRYIDADDNTSLVSDHGVSRILNLDSTTNTMMTESARQAFHDLWNDRGEEKKVGDVAETTPAKSTSGDGQYGAAAAAMNQHNLPTAKKSNAKRNGVQSPMIATPGNSVREAAAAAASAATGRGGIGRAPAASLESKKRQYLSNFSATSKQAPNGGRELDFDTSHVDAKVKEDEETHMQKEMKIRVRSTSRPVPPRFMMLGVSNVVSTGGRRGDGPVDLDDSISDSSSFASLLPSPQVEASLMIDASPDRSRIAPGDLLGSMDDVHASTDSIDSARSPSTNTSGDPLRSCTSGEMSVPASTSGLSQQENKPPTVSKQMQQLHPMDPATKSPLATATARQSIESPQKPNASFSGAPGAAITPQFPSPSSVADDHASLAHSHGRTSHDGNADDDSAKLRTITASAAAVSAVTPIPGPLSKMRTVLMTRTAKPYPHFVDTSNDCDNMSVRSDGTGTVDGSIMSSDPNSNYRWDSATMASF